MMTALMLISAKLILATSTPHKYEAVKVEVVADNDNTVFRATGKKVLENGWKQDSLDKFVLDHFGKNCGDD